MLYCQFCLILLTLEYYNFITKIYKLIDEDNILEILEDFDIS